jgi:RNA-directed DNA polymerase
VLHGILDLIPVHDAAHGFVRGRSARTHAALHVGQEVVLRLDLEDFFASVAAGRVFGIFRSAGYPEPVAHVLTGLTTTVVPLATWSRVPRPSDPALIDAYHRLGRRLATPHLPQGAPTSPALANLTAFALDRRLAALAAKHGATYSRYADDLTFSGTQQATKALRTTAVRIVRDEGFALNERKQIHATQAGRQRICGIVVNAHPNTKRDDHDRLRAVLHNAARHGPASQNRDGHDDFAAHLQGRIAWTTSVNPRRGARLQQRFDAIDWAAAER